MRRLLRGACAVAVLLTLGVGPAAAQDPPTITRLAGDERIQTAVALSVDAYPEGGAAAVVLARQDVFADALAGGPLAAARQAPLLLTWPEALTPVTQQEIQRVLAPGGTVYLLGGVLALEEAVAEEVAELGYEAQRVEGPTRYDTALAIAAEAADDLGFITIATGNDFPDALIAGSLATPFAGGVVVFTDGERLPEPVEEFLDANPDVSKTTVGPAAATAYPGVFNVAGDTAADRSVAAARAFYDGLEPTGVSLASVEAFPDGLAGASHAFQAGPLPLLLTPRDRLPSAHRAYVAELEASGPSFIYGGDRAITDAVADQLRAALEG